MIDSILSEEGFDEYYLIVLPREIGHSIPCNNLTFNRIFDKSDYRFILITRYLTNLIITSAYNLHLSTFIYIIPIIELHVEQYIYTHILLYPWIII